MHWYLIYSALATACFLFNQLSLFLLLKYQHLWYCTIQLRPPFLNVLVWFIIWWIINAYAFTYHDAVTALKNFAVSIRFVYTPGLGDTKLS
jgi:hypothetical protein